MPHPLVLALYSSAAEAAAGTHALHALGVAAEQISVIARSHQEEGAIASEVGATPGADIEDSRPAARLGEIGGQVLAALALVMPGIGPIVTAGPLSADLGEAAGHAAGGVAAALTTAGVPEARATALQREVEGGGVLLGVHVLDGRITQVRAALASSGATAIDTANWPSS